MAELMMKMPPGKRRLALAMHTQQGELLRTIEKDESENKFVITSTQDVEPILKANREDYNDSPGLKRPGLGTMAARIPEIVIHQWIQMGINPYRPENAQKVLALLDSPDYLFLRTAPGRLSKRPVRHFFPASTPSGSRIARPSGSLRLKM